MKFTPVHCCIICSEVAEDRATDVATLMLERAFEAACPGSKVRPLVAKVRGSLLFIGSRKARSIPEE